MSGTIAGTSPLAPFGDAIFTRLAADTQLGALAAGGVYAALPRSARVRKPYVMVGQRRELRPEDFAGGMQREGGVGGVWIDVWSAADGPAQAQDIQSRIRQLLLRQPLTVPGVALVEGSVYCPEELVYTEPDPDLPAQELFHGVQLWTADLEEAA